MKTKCKPPWEEKDRRENFDRRNHVGDKELSEFISQFFPHNDWTEMELIIIAHQIKEFIRRGR